MPPLRLVLLCMTFIYMCSNYIVQSAFMGAPMLVFFFLIVFYTGHKCPHAVFWLETCCYINDSCSITNEFYIYRSVLLVKWLQDMIKSSCRTGSCGLYFGLFFYQRSLHASRALSHLTSPPLWLFICKTILKAPAGVHLNTSQHSNFDLHYQHSNKQWNIGQWFWISRTPELDPIWFCPRVAHMISDLLVLLQEAYEAC